ncbi:hypothetical protein LEMLEM_LOCUS1767 [Lemmus lemmus]
MYFIRFNYEYVSMAVLVFRCLELEFWNGEHQGTWSRTAVEQPPPWMSSHQFYKT